MNELDRNSVVAFFATTAKDGKTYQVEYFNLDAILSVGYRVNSRRGIDFRRWASAVLKQHLLDGYSLHEQKLLRKGTKDLEKAILLLSETLKSNALVGNMGEEILKIIQEYAKTWHILLAYDEGKLNLPQSTARQGTQLEYHTVKMAITALKENLMQKYDKFQRKQFSCTPCRVFHL